MAAWMIDPPDAIVCLHGSGVGVMLGVDVAEGVQLGVAVGEPAVTVASGRKLGVLVANESGATASGRLSSGDCSAKKANTPIIAITMASAPIVMYVRAGRCKLASSRSVSPKR